MFGTFRAKGRPLSRLSGEHNHSRKGKWGERHVRRRARFLPKPFYSTLLPERKSRSVVKCFDFSFTALVSHLCFMKMFTTVYKRFPPIQAQD